MIAATSHERRHYEAHEVFHIWHGISRQQTSNARGIKSCMIWKAGLERGGQLLLLLLLLPLLLRGSLAR